MGGGGGREQWGQIDDSRTRTEGRGSDRFKEVKENKTRARWVALQPSSLKLCGFLCCKRHGVFEDGVAATRRAAARTSRLVRCMIGRVRLEIGG